MKKTVSLLIIVAFLLQFACGCWKEPSATATKSTDALKAIPSVTPNAVAGQNNLLPTNTFTPVATPTIVPDMPEIEIKSTNFFPERLEAQVPDLTKHQEEREIEYYDPETGKVIIQAILMPEDHHWDYEYDAQGHWGKCMLCGITMATEPHDFNNEGICKKCGFGCEHTFVDEPMASSCMEEGCTRRTCSFCGYTYWCNFIAPTGHSFYGQTEFRATCTAKGLMRYTCAVCGESIVIDIPATGHVAVADPAIEPTCQTEGKTGGTHCAICGEILTPQETISMCDHRYENGICVWCGKKEPESTVSPSTPGTSPDLIEPTPTPWNGGNCELPEMPVG